MLGSTLGGRYQISRHLGGGGFAQTYLAIDHHLPGQPTCVVKQLKPRLSGEEALQMARRLFNVEAQVMYRLGSHDQIPRLFAHFEENAEFYLVQELIDGEVFSQELRDRQRLNEADVISLLQDLLTVLAFVHAQQVVHRDVKPSNLIRRQRDRRLVLIDFGAVKQLEAVDEPGGVGTVTVAVGSSGYMPSEQLAGKPRYSSDVYAAGMVAIQCLTGLYPQKLPEDPDTCEILWREQAQVSPELAQLLDTMVRYDFRQRYPSAKEALAALQSLTAVPSGENLLATPTVVSHDGHLAWLERGDELFQQQRYREAIAAYDRVLQAKADEYLAWFKRGIALENLGADVDAADAYYQVLQLQPEDYLAWYKRGTVLERLQNYTEALYAYEQVVALQPDNYWAWHDQGKVLEALHRIEPAIAAYQRAVQIKPDFQVAIASRKRLLSQLQQVDTLYHLQHYDEAVEACDRAIAENPEDSLAWLMRGMALDNLGRHAEALAAYDQVVAVQPDDHVAWYKRATVLEKLGQVEGAIAAYQRVVQLQPDNHWAWHDRGRLLEQLQRFEAAIGAYDRAMQLRPDFQAAQDGRQRALQALRQPSPAPAEAASPPPALDAELAEAPTAPPAVHPTTTSICAPRTADAFEADGLADDLETYVHTVLRQSEAAAELTDAPTIATPTPTINYVRWFQKGQALEKLHRYSEALTAFEQAAQIRDDDPDLWRWRGNVLSALKQYESAIAAYDRAIALSPEDSQLWCATGLALLRLKRHTDALASFEQAAQLAPRNHVPWYWRGQILWALKRYPEALRSFNQALARKSDFQPARRDRQKLVSWLKSRQRRQTPRRDGTESTPPTSAPDTATA